MTTTAERASKVSQTAPETAQQHSAAEYAALRTMVAGLSPEDWSSPTDCTEWTVRDMLAHLAGAAEEAVRIRVAARHNLAAFRGVRRDGGVRDFVDYTTRAQIADRARLSDEEVRHDLERWTVKAPAARRRIPGVLRRIPLPSAGGLRQGATVAYLMDVIYLRDIWLHRIDLHRATGTAMPATDAEAEVVVQVVKDLALDWDGPPFTLALTGRVDGSWLVGRGEPVATVSEDAVALMRLLSGRSDECVMETDGEDSVALLLRKARVVF